MEGGCWVWVGDGPAPPASTRNPLIACGGAVRGCPHTWRVGGQSMPPAPPPWKRNGHAGSETPYPNPYPDHLVVVAGNVGEQAGDAGMAPIPAHGRQQVPQHIAARGGGAGRCMWSRVTQGVTKHGCIGWRAQLAVVGSLVGSRCLSTPMHMVRGTVLNFTLSCLRCSQLPSLLPCTPAPRAGGPHTRPHLRVMVPSMSLTTSLVHQR